MPAEQFKNIEIIKQIAIFWIVQVQGFWVNKLKNLALAGKRFSGKTGLSKVLVNQNLWFCVKIPISVFLQNGNGVLPFIQ